MRKGLGNNQGPQTCSHVYLLIGTLSRCVGYSSDPGAASLSLAVPFPSVIDLDDVIVATLTMPPILCLAAMIKGGTGVNHAIRGCGTILV